MTHILSAHAPIAHSRRAPSILGYVQSFVASFLVLSGLMTGALAVSALLWLAARAL